MIPLQTMIIFFIWINCGILHTHPSSIRSVQFDHVELHQLRDVVQDRLVAECRLFVENHGVSDRGFSVPKDHELLGGSHSYGLLPADAPAWEKPCLLHSLATRANGSSMVPRRQFFTSQRQVDGLHFAAIWADVWLPVFEVLQSVDAMNSPRGGDVSHPERQRNLFGQAVQESVEGFEGAAVDDDAQAIELRISTFVETDPFGYDGVDDARLAGGVDGVPTPWRVVGERFS